MKWRKKFNPKTKKMSPRRMRATSTTFEFMRETFR
jgi:hypothetical protein